MDSVEWCGAATRRLARPCVAPLARLFARARALLHLAARTAGDDTRMCTLEAEPTAAVAAARMLRPRSSGRSAPTPLRVDKLLLLRLALVLAAASRGAAQWTATVYAGSTSTAGHTDGALTSTATFNFSNGNGLAFAPNGTLYAADNLSLRVVDQVGSTATRTLLTGSGFTTVCVDASSGAVYAIDYGASPTQLVQLYSNGKRQIATGFSALACAVDTSGNIIVANTYSYVRARVSTRPGVF